MARAATDQASSTTLAPLKNPTFRAMWLASQVSSLGWLMQTVATSWLMATISASDVMVALVPAASTLPAFILSIFAGAIADNFSCRSAMLAGRCLMTAAFAILTLLLAMNVVDPWIILGLTFLAGCGAAFNDPAWQASVGDMVDRRDIPGAVVLISVGFNTSPRSLIPTTRIATSYFSIEVRISIPTRWIPSQSPWQSMISAGSGHQNHTAKPSLQTNANRAAAFGGCLLFLRLIKSS